LYIRGSPSPQSSPIEGEEEKLRHLIPRSLLCGGSLDGITGGKMISKQKTKIGVAVKLKKAVKYQKDSVVSQEILKKRTGTVTLFAFDKGQGLSTHSAPFDALVYIVDGKAEITIANKRNTVKKGEYIILPANKPHGLQAKTKFKMMLTMIRSN
jgi:quercetin dioxygenase-like cupin family protein